MPGTASQIILDFVDPAGARTGSLLPSGAPLDAIDVPAPHGGTATLRASLVDATNPSVFLSASDLRSALGREIDYTNPAHLDALAAGLAPLANTPVLVLGVQSDILFPVEQQREVADALRVAGNQRVSYYEVGGVWGHDTFL